MDMDSKVPIGVLCSRYPFYDTEFRPLRFAVLHPPQVRMPLGAYFQFIQSDKLIDSENRYIEYLSWTSTSFFLSQH